MNDRRERITVVLFCAISAISFYLLATCPSSRAAEKPDRSMLVLEMRFEGDLADTSNAERVGKAQGTVALVGGRVGKCAAFDGQAWIDTGLQQKELGDEFTVECWVNPGPRQNQHADIFGNHVSEGLGFVLQQDGGNTNQFLAAYGAGDGRWVMTDAVSLTPGRWQHVALAKARDGLRMYLNGVLVAWKEDSAPARLSPMSVAVGLGYTDRQRCFQGRIDEFRIWNKALADFDHAGIDATAARETRAAYLDDTPRPTAGALVESWTLATDDTRVTLGVTAEGRLVIAELSCPQVGWNWIARPVAFSFVSNAEIAGQTTALRWRFVDGHVDDGDGRTVTLRFACDDPPLEIDSRWQAHPGPGPVHHCMLIHNRSSQTITLGDQPTFDVDLGGAAAIWRFHSDGGTPDAVGVYRDELAGEAGRRSAASVHTPGSGSFFGGNPQPLAETPTPKNVPDPLSLQGEQRASRERLRFAARTTPRGEFIPYVVFEAVEPHGTYFGLEWSYCRIEAMTLANVDSPSVRVRGGNAGEMRCEIAAGATSQVRPGFVGAYSGSLDDAGNRLRRWLMRHCVPEILRRDAGYPKVQWNAFGATGKAPGSWDPVEAKYYPLIDEIVPLGFEEVMIDVGWWQGNEPDSDPEDWPSGMKKAADYAHDKGLRFGLYWTDAADMARPEGRRQRADRVKRLFREYGADMWRSDCTRGEVIAASYAATCGFYEMVDTLGEEIDGFQWENCCGGGRIKDYGAMRRAIKIFNSDTYSPLHVRQAFYDSSYAFHPIQIEGHLGSVDGRYRPRGAAGIKYAFRSTSMGAPEWFLDAPNGGNSTEPWTQEEKETLKACVETYKTELRPLVREADLYHILPRPNGQTRDGIEYYDAAAGKGVIYLFQPIAAAETEPVCFQGLEPARQYHVRFADGTHSPLVKSGKALMDRGLPVTLEGAEVSELIFFETVSEPDNEQNP